MVKPALAIELRGSGLFRASGRIAARPEQIPDITAADRQPDDRSAAASTVSAKACSGWPIRGIATALSGHRRIRMMNPRGSGSSACRSVPVAHDVIDQVRDMISRSRWHGLFMVELLRDDAESPWFMELNGRAWGSMALARHRGYRYPSWAVQAAT